MMRAVSFHSPQRVDVVEQPLPHLQEGEALVRIRASALCGSDLHAPPGSNPGHEAAGILESVPSDSGFMPGDAVGISAVVGCGECHFCRCGEQTFCARVRVLNGLHADYAAVPLSALRRLPQKITHPEAVLLTGDACGVPVRALRKVPHQHGGRVAVIGLGPVGLAHVLVRSHEGAEVIGIEPSEYRRALAMELGASAVFEPGQEIFPAPDLVIESTGVPACVQQAFELVAHGGAVLQSGWCQEITLDVARYALRKEVTYTGSWYYADNDYPRMLQLWEGGLPVGRMMTHEFAADDAEEAYRAFAARGTGKVVLHW